MARRYGAVKAGKLKHTANHIRETMGTEEELRALGRSYLRKPLSSIVCSPDLMVWDGNRRLEGVLLEGGPDVEVPVCVVDEPINASVLLEIQLESAIHSRGLSAYEEYVGASQWLEENPDATAEQLGESIGRKPSWMSRLLSLSRCIPAAKEAAASELLGITEWYELSKCTEQQQQELLAARLSGEVSNRDQLAQAVRQRRSGSTTPIKLSKVKIAMPQATVIITGQELSMGEVVDLLANTLKEARKAADQFDVKTWQSMMKDKAKSAT